MNVIAKYMQRHVAILKRRNITYLTESFTHYYSFWGLKRYRTETNSLYVHEIPSNYANFNLAWLDYNSTCILKRNLCYWRLSPEYEAVI